VEFPVDREEIPALRKMPQGVELRHLRYFVAVADAGTFTHAAERMFIAQPTLSQQIRRLEEMVGTPLLLRHPEGVRLTAAGSVFLEEARTVLSLVKHGVTRTRQTAGLGQPRLRVAIPPDAPDALAAAVTRLRDTAAGAGVEVSWLETLLDTGFSLIREHQASAGLGWLSAADEVLPAPLDVMHLGDFEPDTWIPAAHPAARRRVISLDELACLKVVHGPREVSPRSYDSWRAVLRSADPRFEFTDPPFQRSLAMTLAFAAAARWPTAVLTGPQRPAGAPDATAEDQPATAHGMVSVRVAQSPLTACAALVWHSDLPRPLQQVLFDAADGLTH
jgi:DNA-binding transcriptional LysR family regulator